MTQNSSHNCSISPIKGFTDNYFWKLSVGSKAVIVDPGDASAVIADLEKNQQTLTSILITHHHADHIGGVIALKDRYNCPIYGPSKEAQNVVQRPLHGDECFVPEGLSDSAVVIEVPGHTAGHISYYFHELKALFCGDTLFAGGCGRIFEGTAAQMYQSLQKLAQLPENTQVYCAHEYTLANLKFAISVEPHNKALQLRLKSVEEARAHNKPTVPSSIGEELATNPFLRVNQTEIRQAAESTTGYMMHSDEETFAVIRKMKDVF